MPTITYQRIWCKKCNDFTLHSYSQGEAECKTCDAIYTEVWLSEIPKEKIIEQRQRYKARKIKRFGNMFGAYLNPIEASLFTEFKKADIIESDAGQKGIDEERNKIIQERIDKRRELDEEQKKYKGVQRNDLCLCGSGNKYKNCHLIIFNEGKMSVK